MHANVETLIISFRKGLTLAIQTLAKLVFTVVVLILYLKTLCVCVCVCEKQRGRTMDSVPEACR